MIRRCDECGRVEHGKVPCVEAAVSRSHQNAERARRQIKHPDLDRYVTPEPDAEALAAEKARRHARARHVLDERRREEASDV